MVLLQYHRFIILFKVLLLGESILLFSIYKIQSRKPGNTGEEYSWERLFKKMYVSYENLYWDFFKGQRFHIVCDHVIFSRVSQYTASNHSQAQGRIAVMFSWWFHCPVLSIWLLWTFPSYNCFLGRVGGLVGFPMA